MSKDKFQPLTDYYSAAKGSRFDKYADASFSAPGAEEGQCKVYHDKLIQKSLNAFH